MQALASDVEQKYHRQLVLRAPCMQQFHEDEEQPPQEISLTAVAVKQTLRRDGTLDYSTHCSICRINRVPRRHSRHRYTTGSRAMGLQARSTTCMLYISHVSSRVLVANSPTKPHLFVVCCERFTAHAEITPRCTPSCAVGSGAHGRREDTGRCKKRRSMQKNSGHSSPTRNPL